MSRSVLYVLAVSALALVGATVRGVNASAQSAAPQNRADEFFEARVRPVLFARCYGCHGPDQQMSGLRLDSRAALLKGGAHGPAVVAGDADKSLLVQAVRYTGALKMPPTGKLKPEEVEALTQWVAAGSPWPAAKPGPSASSAKSRFWSFQPVRLPTLPSVKAATWVQSPIDRFILAKLEARGLRPSAPADRRTLIRRATFDLTGLPPTPAEVDAFLADRRPGAFARVVDRLLASPRYGERWGRHWLDVARYADTKGYVFTEDSVYHNAYNYRDYVIRAFNADLPYDRFVEEQLAADLLPTQSADRSSLAALGFLTLGRRFLNDPALINDDRIDVTCRGLMGLTVTCARCHDHKFDPIPSRDYYGLYGVFASSTEPEKPVSISPTPLVAAYDTYEHNHSTAIQEVHDLANRQVTALRARLKADPHALPAAAQEALAKAPEGKPVPDEVIATLAPYFDASAQTSFQRLRQYVADLEKAPPPKPEYAQTLQEAPKPFDPYIFKRGNPDNHGEPTTRHFLEVIAGPDPKPFAHGSGRLEMAQAIADASNPLTARVIVNRVWMYHFGEGLVRTPGDFGTRGERPTHPELLDWLAYNFTRSYGWSLKKLHRAIMLSSAYQQSSTEDPHAAAVDPENRLVWRQSRQRLDLEALRDSLLAVSGKLDLKMGGPSVDMLSPPYTTRRTVYGFIERQNLPGLFRTFDFASPDTTSAQRHQTTVPQQALYLMNSPFVVEMARALAARTDLQATDNVTAVRRLYRLLFGRQPSGSELSLAQRFLRAQPSLAGGHTTVLAATVLAASGSPPAPQLSPWERYCQALLMTNEFDFVD